MDFFCSSNSANLPSIVSDVETSFEHSWARLELKCFRIGFAAVLVLGIINIFVVVELPEDKSRSKAVG